MEQIKTYEIGASPTDLKDTLEGRVSPENLLRPLQALATDIATRAQNAPVTVYLCCANDDREARSYLGALLARTLQHQLPDTLLVDCDFLEVGLSGIVPQHDALGFLDMLLYGSSLGVIRQSTAIGVNVIGAGSFPVSRNSPFVMDVFESASRYLNSHSKCVIYCGPALDDDQQVHPIVDNVDLSVLLRVGVQAPAGGLDALEDTVSRTRQALLWTVRLLPVDTRPEPVAGAVDASEPPVDETVLEDTMVLAPDDETTSEQPVYDQAPVYEAPQDKKETASPAPATEHTVRGEVHVDEPSAPRGPGGGTSVFPKVVATILLILLPAFFLWWLHLTKSVREQNTEPQEAAGTLQQPTATPPPTAQVPDTLAAATTDTVAKTQGIPATTAKKPAPKPEERDPSPPPSEDLEASILVTEDILDFNGKFMVHISSFRRLDHAREEAYYLNDRGYPIVIANEDLGTKGKWFRVYVGPFDRRSQASSRKKRLDGIPRVKFTRITKVEG